MSSSALQVNTVRRCPLRDVRETTARVVGSAIHAKLDDAAIIKLAGEIAAGGSAKSVSWDFDTHFHDGGDGTVQYLLVLDALNFCFWPSDGTWEYGDLAKALKKAMQADAQCFSADRLASLDEETLRVWLGGRDLPMMDERVRLLREVGEGLRDSYGGLAANLVRSAEKSASRLVASICGIFSGFRDHAVYGGRQIFVGDVWGAFQGQGLGCFTDIDQMTMFADYRVPQVLQACRALCYSDELARKITNRIEIEPGSAEEIEIRACTVQAVERLRSILESEHKIKLMSIQVDWYLWEEGERRVAEGTLPTHHRTLTIYY